MDRTVRLGFVPSVRQRGRGADWYEKMRAESIKALSAIEGVDLLAPQPCPAGEAPGPEQGYTLEGVVTGLDDAEGLAAHFQREKVDGLILCPLNFGDERSASKIAEMLRVPVLLYATKEPPAPDDVSLARLSDSYCGNLSMASGLFRRKIPFHYAGLFFPDELALRHEVAEFARAVSVVKGLKGARIGQVGVRPTSFETVGYDEAAMIAKFGQNVIYANMADVVDRAKAMNDDDPEVARTVAAIRAGVTEITVADSHVLNAAKFEVALAEFWRANRLSAMAVQCWPSIQRMLGISLCAVYGRLTDQGMLTACEVDIIGALSMLVNYRAALGQTAPHFIDWTIQHRENPNWLLAWHCGNAPLSLASDPAQTALRSRNDMLGVNPAPQGDVQSGLYQFQLKPGLVTFCRLAEYDGQWKMLIARGEIIPTDETLAGTWSWVQVRDHAHLYRTLVEQGFIHHASMIHGDQTAALTLACKFLDIQPVVVA